MHPDNPPRILRTLVFRSGVDEKSILEEAGNGMDALCLDLEDSTPKDRLGEARETFRGIAGKLTEMGVVVMARINAIEDGAEEDLEAVICPELHCINIPKASTSDQLRQYVSLIDKAESSHGMPVGYTLVRPVTETAEGVMRAFEIFSASERIAYAGGVTGSFGGDLGWTVGMDYTPDGIESLYLRSKIIIEARVAGVPFPHRRRPHRREDRRGPAPVRHPEQEARLRRLLHPGHEVLAKLQGSGDSGQRGVHAD